MDEVSQAYDTIAPTYDAAMARDGWMRQTLHAKYDALFPSGSRVLDIGCGTGTDLIHLADRGVSVVGVDRSPGMLAVLRRKLDATDLQPHVRVVEGGLGDVAAEHGGFDGAIAAYAVVNSQSDLRPFADRLFQLVKPGCAVVIHGLCHRQLLRHRRAEMVEEWARIGDARVRHWRHAPMAMFHTFFADQFGLISLQAMGLLPGFRALDRGLGARPPLNRWGRFFLLVLERNR